MREHAILTVELPPGPCVLMATRSGLASVRLVAREAVAAELQGAGGPAEARAIVQEAAEQLRAYFGGRRRRFEIPVDLAGGTAFQERVLRACAEVPYGETVSYGELARRCGQPGAARAVGQVMATNRLPLVVPCHRVIAAGGGLGGYGYGTALKEALLAMERQQAGWAEVAGQGADSASVWAGLGATFRR
ncbi:methylated-DNA--[protein]-cysteine S-methyltransferase [bacterium]|nr:methylated-DNA--[protein]-cysteine S-methyltransferase [bacterium]